MVLLQQEPLTFRYTCINSCCCKHVDRSPGHHGAGRQPTQCLHNHAARDCRPRDQCLSIKLSSCPLLIVFHNKTDGLSVSRLTSLSCAMPQVVRLGRGKKIEERHDTKKKKVRSLAPKWLSLDLLTTGGRRHSAAWGNAIKMAACDLSPRSSSWKAVHINRNPVLRSSFSEPVMNLNKHVTPASDCVHAASCDQR